MNPLLLLDFYKTDHRRQYPTGTQQVYSNLTARAAQYALAGETDCVFFGLQYWIKQYLIEDFNNYFFNREKDEVIDEYRRVMSKTIGLSDVSHIEELHDYGRLPLKIHALPEGTCCPIRTPMMTMWNTQPQFFWLTNALETCLSNVIWKPIVSATIARKYRRTFEEYAERTGGNTDFIDFQGHDFSYRGMSGTEDAMLSGAAHLLSFKGTDTVPSILLLDKYYHGDLDNNLVGTSVPATEHSVMCMGQKLSEIETFRKLITETYPTGIVSIVSDTWDFWKVVTEYLPALKDEIMARDGKVVIRPDSGDPVKIICGDPSSDIMHVKKGLIECLYETFGGDSNEAGFDVLDPHIGAIYGDSITPERQREILSRLEHKKFASDNIVLGIGSYTYQYNTRDTLGMAVKATCGIVNGEVREIFKDPKTDSGTKKSAKGYIRVNEDLSFTDQVSFEESLKGKMEPVFDEGRLLRDETLCEIRSRVNENH